MPSELLAYSDEIAEARTRDAPIVALESTIITHGLPFPQNLETALAVEASVREAGAVPATIAISGGWIRIGLSNEEIAELARGERPAKVSRGELAATVAAGAVGSTTVASTAIAAHLAGVPVFATGGIGGVHRGAESTFDVSADLDELAQTPVVVVSAGAKGILDLPKTLEVLETRGVPVIGFRTDTFPAFWSRSSGLPLALRADSAAEVAAIHAVQRRLGLAAGLLVANPVPPDDEIPFAEMQRTVDKALAEAEAAGVRGKEVTGFILARIAELSGGRSVTANIALVRNNARLAAEIACEIAAGDA